MPHMNPVIARHGLAKLAFHVEDAVRELGGGVGHEPRFGGVKHLDVRFQYGEKDGFPPAYELGDAVADDLKSAGRVIHAADDPFRIAHNDAGAGGWWRVGQALVCPYEHHTPQIVSGSGPWSPTRSARSKVGVGDLIAEGDIAVILESMTGERNVRSLKETGHLVV